jgi:16S rRNA (uracil1498-N3)-methyltransferase
MNMLILEPGEMHGETEAMLTGDRAHRLDDSKDFRDGQKIRVGVLGGRIGSALICRKSGGEVILRCDLNADPPVPVPIDLLLAVPRPKVLKRLWAQLSAIGVRRIFLLNAANVERCYFDTHWIDPVHYRPLLVQGIEQACLTRLPEVRIVRRLKPFLEDHTKDLFSGQLCLAGDPAGAPIVDICRRSGNPGFAVAVGPERGWTDGESGMLESQGFKMVRIGQSQLRVDTACVGLLCAVLAMQ